jgi:hypothetical protein
MRHAGCPVSQHFITTKPIPATCRRCAALTLTGHAEGIRATVDPIALSTPGRLAAILAGRVLYALDTDGLVERTAWRQTHPPGPTLAAHRCHEPIPAQWHAPPGEIRARYVIPDQPPY